MTIGYLIRSAERKIGSLVVSAGRTIGSLVGSVGVGRMIGKLIKVL